MSFNAWRTSATCIHWIFLNTVELKQDGKQGSVPQKMVNLTEDEAKFYVQGKVFLSKNLQLELKKYC